LPHLLVSPLTPTPAAPATGPADCRGPHPKLFLPGCWRRTTLQSAAREREGQIPPPSCWFALKTLLLANEWDRQHAQKKRGGFTPIVSIDPGPGRVPLRLPSPPTTSSRTSLFDRQLGAHPCSTRPWRALQQEYAATGRAKTVRNAPQPAGQKTSPPSPLRPKIATRLSLTEPAVKMAVHRLRARFIGKCSARRIAQTVSSAAEVEEEIRPPVFGVWTVSEGKLIVVVARKPEVPIWNLKFLPLPQP